MTTLVGIDKISFYTTPYYIDLDELARGRDVDNAKFKIGLGQEKMSIITPHEDIVTMGCEAAADILTGEDIEKIDLVLFATESGFDFSKSAGIYLHKLLNLNENCRVLEVKQACYAATGAVQLACAYVRGDLSKKCLVISSDIAWYGFKNAGEVTQGCGAVAMVISANPNICAIQKGNVFVDNISDFYRPSFAKEPIVEGKLSIKTYRDILGKTLIANDYKYCCFHMPFAMMADKANKVLGTNQISSDNLEVSKAYCKIVGNVYNGSLYLSLLSVLINAKDDLSNEEIGMFSYGSGAIGEFFTAKVSKNYLNFLQRKTIENRLKNRKAIPFEDYLKMWSIYSEREWSANYIPAYDYSLKNCKFLLAKIENGHRVYAAN